MPHRMRKSGRGKSRTSIYMGQGNEDESIAVPFRRWLEYTTIGSSSNMLGLTANTLGDVISAMRTSFLHWRLTRLRIRLLAANMPGSVYNSGYQSVPDAVLGVGFIALDSTKLTSTPSWNSASQLAFFNAESVLKGETRLAVPLRELRKTTVPWLETTSTSSESEAFQEAGTVWYGNYTNTGAASGSIYHLLLEGVVQFRDRVDNSVSFALGLSANPLPHPLAVTAEEEEEKYAVVTPPAASAPSLGPAPSARSVSVVRNPSGR